MRQEQTENKYLIFDCPRKRTLKLYAKYVIRALYVLYLKVFMLWAGRRVQSDRETRYDVAICAIFKNEASYLREWIEFHRMVGVDHFYLYNNNSDDDYLVALGPYIEEGIVSLTDWPKAQGQNDCYLDCIARNRREAKWLGFIDLDEFVVPKSTDTLYEFLKQFNTKACAIKIYWRYFGTSGRALRDITGLVTEDFMVCWPKHSDVGKCFYNTAFEPSDTTDNNVLNHSFYAKIKGITVPMFNVFGIPCWKGLDWAPTSNFPIQINHYLTKSREEYRTKQKRTDAFFEVNPRTDSYFWFHERRCCAVDYSAYPYLVELKKRLREIEANVK